MNTIRSALNEQAAPRAAAQRPATRPTPLSVALATALAVLAGAGAARDAHAASAEQITADFTRQTSPDGWIPQKGTCLTAGTSVTGYASASTTPLTTIPGCDRKDYVGNNQLGGNTGTLAAAADPDTKGALRLTNAANYEYGGLVSTTVLPGNRGLSVTFSTVTYNGTGADGIGFFMVDAGADGTMNDPQSSDVNKKFILGATGGALGISCSNSNPVSDGLSGSFIGLGIDEFGNFLNKGDNTSSGIPVDTTVSPTTSSAQFQANRIGLRGRGDTNFRFLQKTYPDYYPNTATGPFGNYSSGAAAVGNQAANRIIAVKRACSNGYVSDWSNYTKSTDSLSTSSAVKKDYPGTTLPNYKSFWDPSKPPANTTTNRLSTDETGSTVLPATNPIGNKTASARTAGTPITYRLKISSGGALDFSYSYNGGAYQSVLAGFDLTSGNTTPLPQYLRFGFTASTGGQNFVHELTCFRAATDLASSASASVNTQQSGRLRTGTQVFTTAYTSDNWWGRIASQGLSYDQATNTVQIGAYNWDASCVLTGGNCATTGATGMVAQGPSARNVLSWSGSAGVPFALASLSTAARTALNDSDSRGSDRVAYLRGERSLEFDPFTNRTGLFRQRTSVLGDIIGSSPAMVGDLSPTNYPAQFSDLRNPTATARETSYATFATANAGRQNAVLVGANDGMLHAFRAGKFGSNGAYDATTNDGRELFAFMPGYVSERINTPSSTAQSYANKLYAHAYQVDAPPAVGDLYYNGSWATWAVGGLGSGGKALYALNVTNPASVTEATAAGSVIGEWNDSTISCTGNTSCGTSLGYTFGTPVIRRLHNGSWGVLFGNGYNSSTGTAGLFIMIVDAASGARTFRFIDTGAKPATPSATASNGMYGVSSADLDGDRIIDYAYAGDLFGNLWRFDLTSADPASWTVRKVFAGSSAQPITSAPAVAIVQSPDNKAPRVLVMAGTGQRVDQTLTSATSFASGQQYMYGVWDFDFTAWNAPSTNLYAFSALPSSTATPTVASLTAQTMTSTTVNGLSARTMSSNKVCWQGSTVCASTNTAMGWKVSLSTSDATPEQLISAPVLYGNALAFNTTIPNSTTGTLCTPTQDAGFTMVVDPATGGATTDEFFTGTGKTGGRYVGGIQLGATGSPNFVQVPVDATANSTSASTKAAMVFQKQGGSAGGVAVNLIGGKASRLTWIENR